MYQKRKQKFKELHLKDKFQIELRNRFAILNDGPDLDIENKWEAGRNIITKTCEEVLGRKSKQNERLAFDSVDREGMSKLLRHYGIPPEVVNMIKAVYEDFTVQVIHESSFTNPFQVNTGVKQGCLLSPTLFLIAINWLTKLALHEEVYNEFYKKA
ncbi:unnamed protein product [Mytilus coruscus]|uniref:Reverse transcriptase domain-containing protein n=1 Tax=Mytilus coruscus TaxID=42192 RepID=A0A6J8EPS0_MYTCO|nr:unnamed protein product [Mytilus coruscus]